MTMISRHWAMSSRHPLAAKWKSARNVAKIPQSLTTDFWCQSAFWCHMTATNDNPLLRITLLGPPKDAERHFEASICKGNKNIATKRPVNTRYWPPIFEANQNFGHPRRQRMRIHSSEWHFYGRRRLWTTHVGLHWQKQWESCSETTRSTTEFDHRFLMRIRFWTPMAATNENP